ncbi:MAG: FAD-binding oxidoreductase [Thermoanaerobaculia bacterium]|nr:FAD-binding oxidoreductase [Thermoanaerobaculia bacterium]
MSDEESGRSAVRDWRAELGEEKVLVGKACAKRYGPNVTEYPQRRLVGALFPHDTRDVVQIVRIANEHRVPLYPVSRGCNWGLGSKQPPVDDCAIVDLSNMDRILGVDTDLHYAVVQPGVSQKALFQHLREHDIPLVLNVTGAGGQASVLGNALERGVGMLGQRHRDVRGLEVVLGTGEVLRTGSWGYTDEQDACSHHYPEGLGPDLMGLFMQSNLGIVTAAAVDLQPRQDVCLMLAEVSELNLSSVVDALARLRARQILRDRIEIMADDDPRLGSIVEQAGKARTWQVWVAMHGPESLLHPQRDLIEVAIGDFCQRLRFWREDDVAAEGWTGALGARFDLVQGRPSDYSIESMLRRYGADEAADADLDHEQDAPGFVCVLPAVPLQGAKFQAVVAVVDEVSRELGVDVFMSFASVSSTAAEGFIRVPFDRNDPRAVAIAHRWNQEIHTRLLCSGTVPLRVNIEQLPEVIASGGDTGWETVRAIKKALDPNDILAPGRYCPPS